MTAVGFIRDLECLFKSTADNTRIARILNVRETRDLARSVGVPVRSSPYTREVDLIEMIRLQLQKGKQPRACSGCVLSGRRWLAANAGRPITHSIDYEALEKLTPTVSVDLKRLLDFITGAYGVKFEPARNVVPDFTMDAGEIDSMRGGTLGTTTTFVSQSDDIDVGKDRFISAHIRFDTMEFWDRPFFFTVCAHELFHLLGLDHAPDEVLADLMKAFYQGPLFINQFGLWSHQQMLQRYVTGTLPA